MIPEELGRRELNKRYRAIPLEDKVFRELRKYCNAFANLYGVISVSNAYTIIKGMSPGLVTKQEFIEFTDIARHENEDYVILGKSDFDPSAMATAPMDREIIDRQLVSDGPEPYHWMVQAHRGKQYVVLDKKELLGYADGLFYDNRSQGEALQKVLSECFDLDPARTSDLFDQLLFGVRYKCATVAEAFTFLEKHGYTFKDVNSSFALLKAYGDFYRTSRPQIHRGATFGEMEIRVPVRRASANGERPKPKKVGRNDLCPCGSGKKYKKCCGRFS